MDGRYGNSELGLIRTIKISKSQKQVLQNHVQKWSPSEACAILYGRNIGDTVVTTDVFLTDNADDSPVSFAVPDEQLIKAYDREDGDVRIIAMFHSHPASEARPSSKDVRFMGINPQVWVIYSGISSEFRAYILKGITDPPSQRDIMEIVISS